MKQALKRMAALFLASSMALTLVGTGAWAEEIDADELIIEEADEAEAAGAAEALSGEADEGLVVDLAEVLASENADEESSAEAETESKADESAEEPSQEAAAESEAEETAGSLSEEEAAESEAAEAAAENEAAVELSEEEISVLSVEVVEEEANDITEVNADADSTAVELSAANFPDDVFRAYLEDNYDTDEDGYLSTAEIEKIHVLSLSDKGIADLTGIAFLTSLTSLYCGDNSLTSLDVSSCPNLQELHCDSNSLTSLDVSVCPNLQELYCYYNSLTSLDVSGCTNLGLVTLEKLDKFSGSDCRYRGFFEVFYIICYDVLCAYCFGAPVM